MSRFSEPGGALPRVRHLAALLTVSIAATGCHAAYPLTAPLGTDSRELVVRFLPPRPMEGRTAAGVLRREANVESIRGRAITVRSDTLVLEVEWLQKSDVDWKLVSPTVVMAVPIGDPAVRIRERRISPGRTLAAVVLLPPVIAWIALYIYCSGDCFND